MNLLCAELLECLHKSDMRDMGEELGATWLKLFTESTQVLINTVKLQVRTNSLATQTRTTSNNAQRIELALDGRTLSVEPINGGVTLLKRVLLANH